MLENLLIWFAKTILEVAFDRATRAAREYAERLARDKERNEINEENLRKYEAAADRAERVRAGLDLLNGTRSP